MPTNVVIELGFSDYPDPDAASLDTIVLTSGFFRRTGSYSVDLVDRKVKFRPTLALDPNLEYTVSVQPHMRSIQGCRLGRLEQRSFRTGAGPAPDPAARPAVPFTQVLSLFAQSCAGAGCHRDPPDATGAPCQATRPPRGLSLCDDRAYDDLVGVRAAELGRLMRVAPRDSARSYILRKLLRGPLPGRPMPTTAGDIMPPPGGMSDEAVRAIADWIDAGAPRG